MPILSREDDVLSYFLTMGEECTRVWRDPTDWRHNHVRRRRVWQALRMAELQAEIGMRAVRVVLVGSDKGVLYETPVTRPARTSDEEPTARITRPVVPMAVAPTEEITRPIHVGVVKKATPPRRWRTEEMSDLPSDEIGRRVVIRKGERR